MVRILTLVFLLGLGASLSQTIYGCSCVTIDSTEKDPKKVRESVRKFYLNEFKGALFTGSVLEINQIKNKIDVDLYTPENQVIIDVEKYWIGVDSPRIVVYTGVGGGDCGVRFEVGKRYFFTTQLIQGVLKTDVCAYGSEAAMSADGKTFADLNEILGVAKSFKKVSKE